MTNNLSYETAKKLKEAGFPQNTQYALATSPWGGKDNKPLLQTMTREEGNDGYANLLSAGYDVVSIPSLSELIDACGEEFLNLIKRENEWFAGQRYQKEGRRNIGIGSTKEEAVAALYLALHNK